MVCVGILSNNNIVIIIVIPYWVLIMCLTTTLCMLLETVIIFIIFVIERKSIRKSRLKNINYIIKSPTISLWKIWILS